MDPPTGDTPMMSPWGDIPPSPYRNRVNSWFINNGMVLNEDKCKFLIIELSKPSRNETALYQSEIN